MADTAAPTRQVVDQNLIWYKTPDLANTWGVNSQYFRQNPWLEPFFGIPHGWMGQARVWHRNDVMPWLCKTQNQLQAE